MADELQALLDRVNEEGLKKAESEKEKIIGNAKEEASEIVSKAKAEAEELKANAQKEADMLVEKGKQALGQAARDTLLSLRKQLQERINTVVKGEVDSALEAASIAEIVKDLAAAYVEKGGTVEQVKLLLPEAKLKEMEGVVRKKLTENLKAETEIAPVPKLTGGFKISFGGDVMYDFSDEALTEAICTFLNPRLAELVKSQ